MGKKILVITQYFYPENFRINDLCIELKKRGHDITVLTGLPNYPKGEYFEGYSLKKNNDENWNGINVFRCNLRARHQGSINLIRNYISFVIEANKKINEIKDIDFDLIYVFEVSPITVALPAIKLKKLKHIPIVINIQDLWPENIIAVTGINNFIINGVINKLVNYIYKYCDLILTASPSFVPKIKKRVKNKDEVVYWPQYSVVSKDKDVSQIYDNDKFNIVFTGNIGEAQGLDLVIETAKQLKNTKIRWQLVGDGRYEEKLKNKVIEFGLENYIFFHGRKPEEEIPKYLSCADAALLILKPDPVFEMTIPAKLQTYLACGVPILGCVSGEGKRIIEESHAGIVTDSITVKGLLDVCESFLNLSKDELKAYSDKAYEYGKANFDRDKLIDRLERMMEELV